MPFQRNHLAGPRGHHRSFFCYLAVGRVARPSFVRRNRSGLWAWKRRVRAERIVRRGRYRERDGAATVDRRGVSSLGGGGFVSMLVGGRE
jgi:hypothetical protein